MKKRKLSIITLQYTIFYKFIIYLFFCNIRIYTIPSRKGKERRRKIPRSNSVSDRFSFDRREITLESKAWTRRIAFHRAVLAKVRISLSLSFSLHASEPKGRGREKGRCVTRQSNILAPDRLRDWQLYHPRRRFYPATLLTPGLSFVMYKPRPNPD